MSNEFGKPAVRTRDELQQEAMFALVNNRRLILNWGTCVGKSRVAVKTSELFQRNGLYKTLLLVAESAHKGNWKKEFIDTFGEIRAAEILSHITIECYASLPKYEGTTWDYIIADEGHHLRGENRTGLIATLKTTYFLILTATLSEKGDADSLIRTLSMSFGRFETLSFGVQAAINNRIIARPDIYIHVLDINKVSAPQTVILDWGMPWFTKGEPKDVPYEKAREMVDNRDSKYKNFKVRCTCRAAQAYELLSDLLEARKAERQAVLDAASSEKDAAKRQRMYKALPYIENSFKLIGSRRKNLLGQCKTAFAKWLLGKLDAEGKKYVCFCTDVAQGKVLGGETVIYSERKGNLDVINDFNEGKIHNLFAIDMIQEGQNLDGIQAGVIIQLGGKERAFVQKFGRALRSKTPEQHLIVIDRTRDVDYLKTAIENIDKHYIHAKKW